MSICPFSIIYPSRVMVMIDCNTYNLFSTLLIVLFSVECISVKGAPQRMWFLQTSLLYIGKVVVTVDNFIFQWLALGEITLQNTKLFYIWAKRTGKPVASSSFKSPSKYKKRRQKLQVQHRIKCIWIFFTVENREIILPL